MKDMKISDPDGDGDNDYNESAEQERAEQPSEEALDKHHKVLVEAEKIRSDKGLMKHLVPHMQKKIAHLKMAINKSPKGAIAGDKIMSIDGLKEKAKSM